MTVPRANSEPRRKGIYKHLVVADGERWVFRRSPAFLAIMFGVLMTAGLLVVPWVLLFFMSQGISEIWFLVVFALLDILGYALSFLPWPWSTNSIVERDGRVRFGRRQLCAPGSVRAVFVTTLRPEMAGWQTYLQLGEDTFVSVPPPYFGDYELGEDAHPLGEELGKALGVQVKKCS